jgi:hypothetical protein
VLYKYTGNPLEISNWDPAFGPRPTHITGTVEVAHPFPKDRNFAGGSVGSFGGRDLPGVISAVTSDGVRTVTPNTVFLRGYGTTIREWIIKGGFLIHPESSGRRAITIWKINSTAEERGGGDFAVFQRTGEGPTSLM